MMIKTMPQEESIKNLYEASLRGSVDILNTLLQNDPLILDRLSLTSYTETPLHVACLLGHVEFAEALLHHKPKLAAELNSQGYSPLHLASAEGHAEIVQALLSINPDTCLVPDQYGRIPLHLAAIRGRVEVIQLLIGANPASVQVKLRGQDQTVLHLCVKYNHLEALTLLVAWMRNDGRFWDNGNFLNSADNDGNTILHLAAFMDQIETLKFLLSIPEARVEADVMARIFRNHPLDFKNVPISDSIAETARTMSASADQIFTTPSMDQVMVQNETKLMIRTKGWKRLLDYLDYSSDSLESVRGHLMTVATVFASMAFQAAISPPGGVWQPDQLTACREDKTCIGLAGTSILAFVDRKLYNHFLFYNTMSFILSLAIIAFIVCGFPLDIKFYLIIILVAIGFTIYYIGGTYIISLVLLKEANTHAHAAAAVYAWFGRVVLAIVVVFHVIRLGTSMFGADHIIIRELKRSFPTRVKKLKLYRFVFGNKRPAELAGT